jgi:hypothetical protein
MGGCSLAPRLRRCAELAACLLLSGCAASEGGPVVPRTDPGAFVEAVRRIEALKAELAGDRTDTISLELDAPYLPSTIKARGAIAVRAPDQLRMIMLGPGGTTAMDLWMKGDRFRFSIPSLGREITGDARTPAEQKRGLPVDFLRAFMLDPLGGRVLAASKSGSELRILLEEGGNISELTLFANKALKLHRSWFSTTAELYEEEWIDATGFGCAAATYRQKTTQLVVAARCEKSRPSLNEAALEEPSAGSGP